MYIKRDIRMPQIKKVLGSIIPKPDQGCSSAMVTNDNKIMVTVRDTAIYFTELKNIEYLPSLYFNLANTLNLPDDDYIFNPNLMNTLNILYSKYIITPHKLLAQELNVTNNERFAKYFLLKSSDSAKFLQINNINTNDIYFIPIFSGFPIVNKADKLDINVYEFYGNYLLVEFKIYKKKIGRDMSILFKTLKLN